MQRNISTWPLPPGLKENCHFLTSIPGIQVNTYAAYTGRQMWSWYLFLLPCRILQQVLKTGTGNHHFRGWQSKPNILFHFLSALWHRIQLFQKMPYVQPSSEKHTVLGQYFSNSRQSRPRQSTFSHFNHSALLPSLSFLGVGYRADKYYRVKNSGMCAKGKLQHI